MNYFKNNKDDGTTTNVVDDVLPLTTGVVVLNTGKVVDIQHGPYPIKPVKKFTVEEIRKLEQEMKAKGKL
jgi:hypothetical protein